MRHFRDFMAEEIWPLEAYLSSAADNARKLLDVPAPATEDQVREHKEIELGFDIQLMRIRQYLNETWRAEPADEDSGPPEAIDEGEEGPRRVRMPLIAGPIEKSSFKITPGDAAVLETIAKKLAQESKAFLEDIEEENEFLNSAAKATFSFLDKISQPGGDGQIRIALKTSDFITVQELAKLLEKNARIVNGIPPGAAAILDCQFGKEDVESAAEALFLFLLNRSKVIPS